MDDEQRQAYRDQREKLIQAAQERQDRFIEEQRDLKDRMVGLSRDLEDAYKDYHGAKRDQNALGMIKALQRISEIKKQIEAMNSKD